MAQLEITYGRHAAIHAQMQATILNKPQRNPALESSFTGFATMFNNHLELDVADLFVVRHLVFVLLSLNSVDSFAPFCLCRYNNPFEDPERKIDNHAAMELQLDGHFL